VGVEQGPSVGSAAAASSVHSDEHSALSDADVRQSRQWLRLRTWWLLVAAVLALGIAVGAAFLTRQPSRIVNLIIPPDRMATAQISEPPLIGAVARRSYDTWIESLSCACDGGNVAVSTGPALRSELRTLQRLQRNVQHWAITPRTWQVDWIHLKSPTSAQLQVSGDDTRVLYQGLVAVKRVSGTFRTRYHVIRLGSGWKITDAAAAHSNRHTAMISGGPRLSAQAAFILDDRTGHALYAYHADTERLVGSTAKMLTAIVALGRINLETPVTVPADAMVGGTSANLFVGERMLARQLFYGMLLPSGNDAARTLAEAVAGSIPAFARLMNVEAGRLQLRHSHFVVPEGLDYQGQYSTARDLALIGHALLRRPFLAGVVRTRFYHATSADNLYSYDWTNLNQLLRLYPGAIGVKTGTTPGAGANLVAAAVLGNRRIIAVILGDSVAARYPDAMSLLNYGWRLLGSSSRQASPRP